MLKFHSDLDTGWMDYILLSPHGDTWWIEFKKPKTGRLGELQKINREWLYGRGHRYKLLDSWTAIYTFLRSLHIEPGATIEKYYLAE